ncbi:MAG: V-type ATP synthase subunit F [Oscillospiraceae bacterium]|nr:V-type ATP synthase subunit F [Oscillospiraceae bacterium]
MSKIAVLGDRDSVLGFRALGLTAFPAADAAEAKAQLVHLAKSDYAIIYITEQLASELPDEISRYKDQLTPAVILIPGKAGTLGLGDDALQSAMERAVGANIL